jgi:hypothetical protein
VSATVPRQKSYLDAVQFADDECVRRFAKWSFNLQFVDVLQFRHLIKPAAADDPDVYLFHFT